jgi:hypothetical protein
MKTSQRIVLLIMAVSALSLGTLRAEQPHMRRALEHLRAARAELQRAEHNKAGWRQKALSEVDRAIVATENGIKAAH